MRQQDFLALFEHSERQRAARRGFIERLPADERVKSLLLALDELASSGSGVPQADGSMQLSVPLEVLIWKLNRSRNTVRTCIDLAGGTPFLVVTPSQHRSHTYLLRWPVIVDHSRPVGETTVGGCKQDAGTPASGRDGATSRPSARGSTRRCEGVNLTPSRGSNRGSIDRGQGGQMGVNLTPSLKDPGFYSSGSQKQKPGSSPDLETPARTALEGVNSPPAGGQPAGPQGRGFWPRWRTALAVRDLSRPRDVEELYRIAVAEGCFPDTEHNRLQVFAQAVHDRQSAKTPKAIFRENVAVARWLCRPDHEDAAAEMIAEVDGFSRLAAVGVGETAIDRQTETDKLRDWESRRRSRERANQD